MSQKPMQWVELAAELADSGWSYRRIVDYLHQLTGRKYVVETIGRNVRLFKANSE